MGTCVNPGNRRMQSAVRSELDDRGELLPVGINYTKKTKKYTCRIEKFEEVH